MNILNGRDLNLYYTINGYQYPACHATDCKLTITADLLETTTKNSIKGKTFNYQGKYTYTLSLSGITNLIDVANISYFQDAILQSAKLVFIFKDENSIEWYGTVLVSNVGLDSPVSALSTFTNDMQGDGELTKVTSGVTPTPPGASVIIVDQLGNVLATVPAPGAYTVFRFDSIDLRIFNPTTGVAITPQLVIMQST